MYIEATGSLVIQIVDLSEILYNDKNSLLNTEF